MARRISPKQREQIRYLRANMTKAEKELWYRLNRDQLGVHFRRQHPVGPYIVDFAAVRPRLVVEVDGPTHFNRAQEVLRETEIIDRGWNILRFSNDQVFSDVEAAVDKIRCWLDAHPTVSVEY